MTAAQLREAIELARAGKKQEAQERLLRILEKEPENEVATFWYIDTLSSDEERARMLQKFLGSHPGHERATVALRSIQVRIESRGGSLADLERTEPKSIETSLVARKPRGHRVEQGEPPKPGGTVTPPGARQEAPPSSQPEKPDAPAAAQSAAPQSNVVDVVAVPPQAVSSPPRPEDFSPPYRPLSPPKKEKSNLAAALTIVFLIILVIACGVVVLVKGIMNNPAFQSPSVRYAGEMTDVMEKLTEWINGPVAEWGEAMTEEVYEGRTYQEVFQLNQKMGYVDVLVTRKLSPIANEIGMGGLEIDNAMAKITPPAEIETAHYQVYLCVRYERAWADAMIGFLERNEPIVLEESPCGSFLDAYRQLIDYVEANQ